MRHPEIARRLTLPLLLLAPAVVTGCTEVSEAGSSSSAGEPISIEVIDESSGLSRLTLTQLAAERLDVTTKQVSEERLTRDSGARRTYQVVPYSSIIYDPEGTTWVYVSPESLAYEREQIAVAFIDGDTAALSDGPPTGTDVVTVGAAELYGAELGVDH